MPNFYPLKVFDFILPISLCIIDRYWLRSSNSVNTSVELKTLTLFWLWRNMTKCLPLCENA